MDANTVYTVAKALPEKEYIQLFNLLKTDFLTNKKLKNHKIKIPVLTNQEAIQHLFDNVFNKE